MWRTGVALLLSALAASGELQLETEPRRLPPPGKLDFGYVPAGVYETVAHFEPGPIGILFHLVQAFLFVVQPNAFPQGKPLPPPPKPRPMMTRFNLVRVLCTSLDQTSNFCCFHGRYLFFRVTSRSCVSCVTLLFTSSMFALVFSLHRDCESTFCIFKSRHRTCRGVKMRPSH